MYLRDLPKPADPGHTVTMKIKLSIKMWNNKTQKYEETKIKPDGLGFCELTNRDEKLIITGVYTYPGLQKVVVFAHKKGNQ